MKQLARIWDSACAVAWHIAAYALAVVLLSITLGIDHSSTSTFATYLALFVKAWVILSTAGLTYLAVSRRKEYTYLGVVFLMAYVFYLIFVEPAPAIEAFLHGEEYSLDAALRRTFHAAALTLAWFGLASKKNSC